MEVLVNRKGLLLYISTKSQRDDIIISRLKATKRKNPGRDDTIKSFLCSSKKRFKSSLAEACF